MFLGEYEEKILTGLQDIFLLVTTTATTTTGLKVDLQGFGIFVFLGEDLLIIGDGWGSIL